MPTIVTKADGFKVSRTAGATQVVLLSHGGWKEQEENTTTWGRQVGDGRFRMPDGYTIFWYSEDEMPGKGLAVLEVVLAAPAEAKTGLVARRRTLDPELEAQARAMGALDQIQAQIEEDYRTAMRTLGGTTGARIKDYALYRDTREPTKTAWARHKSMQAGSYHADIDLMLVRERRTRKLHLSDVFNFIATYNNAYTVIHFAPCRVNRPFDIGATVHG